MPKTKHQHGKVPILWSKEIICADYNIALETRIMNTLEST